MVNITDIQKKTIQAIIATFETGQLPSLKGYATITNIKGDNGGLTYGIHQTSINSGNLYFLIKDYCETAECKYGDNLKPYLDPLLYKSSDLAKNEKFLELLRTAAYNDQLMVEAQDRFFDRVYWSQAILEANKLGINTALGLAVVYDSVIHGSWKRICDKTLQNNGTVLQLSEPVWIKSYNENRREWLATHSNPILRNCVYRQDAFRNLIKGSNWSLALPIKFVSNGKTFTITENMFNIDKPLMNDSDGSNKPRPKAETKESKRILKLNNPLMIGEDVKELQNALNKRGENLLADGEFGPSTNLAVIKFQKNNGLKPDGIVGAATRTFLGL